MAHPVSVSRMLAWACLVRGCESKYRLAPQHTYRLYCERWHACVSNCMNDCRHWRQLRECNSPVDTKSVTTSRVDFDSFSLPDNSFFLRWRCFSSIAVPLVRNRLTTVDEASPVPLAGNMRY
ncbi:unnamed protein product [Scytosiphon promiscuus]